MEATLDSLLLGFSVAFRPDVLLYAFLGCVVGTLVGMLPGIGPLAGISILLPATFGLDATKAIVMLAGIYYGSQYGGSTTSILMRIPGEAASVMTCIDGYAMSRKGRAGAALCIAAIGSFIAGTFGVIALTLIAPPLGAFALRFGPPEYTALLVLGLVFLAYMSSTSLIRTLLMAAFGIMLGCIGIDVMTGHFRYAFDIPELGDGIGIVPVAVGLFGLGEILSTPSHTVAGKVTAPRLRELLPTRKEWRQASMPIARGTVLGFLIGIVPGSAHIISSFVSYALEKRLSRHPEEFGKGAVAGVAGPESANNAASTGAFVPMLSLGLPTGPVTAVLMAALLIHGVPPGPMLVTEHPTVFWGFIASMYVGNLMLLALNLPLVGLFVNVLRIPYAYLYPLIIMFCIIGVYEVNHSIIDVWIMLIMGVVGYLLRKFDLDPAPLVLGLVIAPILEMSLRQSLIMSNGSWTIFFDRPIAGTLLAVSAALLLLSAVTFVMHKDWRSKLAEAGEPRSRNGAIALCLPLGWRNRSRVMQLVAERQAADTIRAKMNYIVDTGVPPVRYIDWPEMEHKEIPPSYEPHEVTIRNGRPLRNTFKLDTHGFIFADHPTNVGDFTDESERTRVYDPEVQDLIKRHSGASEVVVFDHTIRVGDEHVQKNTGARPPVKGVHNDYTENSAPQRLREIVGDAEAERRFKKRWAIIQVWRPIRATVLRDPLGICDGRTIPQKGFILVQRRYKYRTGEVYHIAHSPEHVWYWFPRMERHEALVFKVFDTDQSVPTRFTAHSAFDDPHTPPDAPPRESIETRTFAFWD